MKKKIWLLQLPLILGFTLCFSILELGEQGKLGNRFLREAVFPRLSRASHLVSDFKFIVRGPRPKKNKIVVVGIDSPAIETLGRWPWHRDVMSFLIEKIFASGAKVVGLDIVFSEPDPRIPEELQPVLKQNNLGKWIQQLDTDHVLEEVVRKYSDRLVLAWSSDLACQPGFDSPADCPLLDLKATEKFPPDLSRFKLDEVKTAQSFDFMKTPMISFLAPLMNIPRLQSQAKHLGYVNTFLDIDGYIRRTVPFVWVNGEPYPSLALAMARAGTHNQVRIELNSKQRVKELSFVQGKRNIRTNPLGSMQINFRGPSSAFPHIPALDVLGEDDTVIDDGDPHQTKLSKKEMFKDAYVLIGLTAVGVHDMRQFPFDSNEAGVDGHANILDNLLSGDPLVSGAGGWGSLFVFLLMVFGIGIFAFVMERLEAVPALALFLAFFVIAALIDFRVLFYRDYNLNTAFFYLELGSVFVMALAAKYILEEKNKNFIRGAFSKYVAPAVVDSILQDPSKLSLGGEKRDLTILFSDIRSFTAFSEKMDAKALAAFLNDYFNIMTGIVFSHKGTLDKYIGDAVMAFWGAPLLDQDHTVQACQAAIEMIQALLKNQERFKNQYGIDVEIGIGLNTGVVNVGNMGSDQNFGYTVIGDHVNLASRVESLTKMYGVRILTTHFTLESIRQKGQPLPPHRILDEVKVKGKQNAVSLVQLLEKDLPTEGLKAFEKGRELYKKQKWVEAIQSFEEANRTIRASLGKDDGPSQVFIERCQEFQKAPPESGWDGSWEMHTK